MKGQILDYSIQTNTGIISADDQNRYEFIGAEWRGQNVPKQYLLHWAAPIQYKTFHNSLIKFPIKISLNQNLI